MLRFFEPEVDPWWPASAPPLPQRHYAVAVDQRPHGEDQHSQSGAALAVPAGMAGRRVPSALETVDLVKGRWFPAPASNGSRSPSPNSSSSVDSMNSYGGSGIKISWQSSDANFSLESPSDQSFALFQGERSSSTSLDTATKSQHEAMVDWVNKRRMIDESQKIGMEVAAREGKKQRPGGVHEEKLHNYQPSFESTSSPSAMAATPQALKGVPLSKSKKMGDKITALQQLVSPFGKTDTASVLHEAAVYIKALQEQIKLLSNPYLESISNIESIQVRNGGDHHLRHHHHQQQVHKKSTSLREAGLCMVPISPIVASLVNREPLDGCVSESLQW